MQHRLRIRSLLSDHKLLQTSPRTSVAKVAKLMGIKRVGAIAVVDDGELLGIFTERDALMRVLALGRDPDTTPVSEVMTKSPFTIGPDEPFDDARAIMERHGFRHLPLLGVGGHLEGLALGAGGHQRDPGRVVDQLRVDVPVGAIHG